MVITCVISLENDGDRRMGLSTEHVIDIVLYQITPKDSIKMVSTEAGAWFSRERVCALPKARGTIAVRRA